MRNFYLLFLCFLAASPVCARVNQSERTVRLLQQWSRAVAIHRDGQNPIPCLHTQDVARKHIEAYHAWRKTGQWPKIGFRLTDNSWDQPKPSATSVLRVSRYLYEDSSWEMELDDNGRMAGYGARYDMGPWEGRARYLNARQFNDALRKLNKLPPSQPVFTVQDILVISGRVNRRWITRVYSRHRLPRQVANLIRVLDPKW